MVGQADIEVGGRYSDGAGQVREVIERYQVDGRLRVKFRILRHQMRPKWIDNVQESWAEFFVTWAHEKLEPVAFFDWVTRELGDEECVSLESQEVPGYLRLFAEVTIAKLDEKMRKGTVVVLRNSDEDRMWFHLDDAGYVIERSSA